MNLLPYVKSLPASRVPYDPAEPRTHLLHGIQPGAVALHDGGHSLLYDIFACRFDAFVRSALEMKPAYHSVDSVNAGLFLHRFTGVYEAGMTAPGHDDEPLFVPDPQRELVIDGIRPCKFEIAEESSAGVLERMRARNRTDDPGTGSDRDGITQQMKTVSRKFHKRSAVGIRNRKVLRGAVRIPVVRLADIAVRPDVDMAVVRKKFRNPAGMVVMAMADDARAEGPYIDAGERSVLNKRPLTGVEQNRAPAEAYREGEPVFAEERMLRMIVGKHRTCKIVHRIHKTFLR